MELTRTPCKNNLCKIRNYNIFNKITFRFPDMISIKRFTFPTTGVWLVELSNIFNNFPTIRLISSFLI